MKKFDIKCCTRCSHALVPTAFGWICDNHKCDFEYGLMITKPPKLEKLADALQLNIGKVDYRVNDIVNLLIKTKSDHIKQISELNEVHLIETLQIKDDNDTKIEQLKEKVSKLETYNIILKKKWWYRWFNHDKQLKNLLMEMIL